MRHCLIGAIEQPTPMTDEPESTPSKPKRTSASDRRVDVVRAARVLVDAHQLGDKKAASIHGVSPRSLQNWRALMPTSEPLQAEYGRLLLKHENAWNVERTTALRVVLKRATKLAEKEPDLDKLTRFIEKVGGIDVIDTDLKSNAGSPLASGQSPASSGAEDEEGEGAEEVH